MKRFWFENVHMLLGWLTLILLWAFVLVQVLGNLTDRARDIWRPLQVLPGIPYVVFGLIFAVADIAYNVIVGSLLYLELPQEWFLTTRLKRHKHEMETEKFSFVLNFIDPGHV